MSLGVKLLRSYLLREDVRADDSPQALLWRTMLDAMVQYQRAVISTRTREALATARAAGKRLGRPTRVARGGANERMIVDARACGETWSSIAARFGVGVATARRVVARARLTPAR